MHLGPQEFLLILIIVLVLFGGKKVAGLGKALGTSMREFKEEVHKKDDSPAVSTTETVEPSEQHTVAKEDTNERQK